MRIAHVVYPYYPLPLRAYGGVERGVYLLACEQARQGHQVYVSAHHKSQIPGCKVIGCNPKGLRVGQKQADVIRHLCQQETLDIIHDHSPWGLLGKTECQRPVIRTIYGDPFKKYVHTLRLDTVVSFTTRAFVKFYGYPNAPIIRPAVCEKPEDTPFNPDARAAWVVFIGVMAAYKGPHMAIAWARHLNRSLLLFGPVKDEKYFEIQIVPRLDVNVYGVTTALNCITNATKSIIVYGGVVDRQKIWDIYLQAHATLVTSQCAEAMSRVVQESMLTGCPVYACRAGGIPEVMDSYGGICSSDINAIMDYDKNRRTREYDPVRARQHICDTKSVSVMYQDSLELYEKVLADG